MSSLLGFIEGLKLAKAQGYIIVKTYNPQRNNSTKPIKRDELKASFSLSPLASVKRKLAAEMSAVLALQILNTWSSLSH